MKAAASPEPFVHRPVLRDEVVALFAQAPLPGFIVDGTVGGAGHAAALLEAYPELHVVGLDQDPRAVAVAQERLARFGPRVTVVHARFSEMARVVAELGIGPVAGCLVDLGVSSHQLDTPSRGFSFRRVGPLDMRMDPTRGRTAAEAVAELDVGALTHILRTLGEERRAGRVARAIVREQPQTTEALADLVRGLVPRAKDGIDPATRTFQALRMHVNDELGELGRWIEALPEVLAVGGIAQAISFHSLEDRQVKHGFRDAARGCVCPPSLPVCACSRVPTLTVVTPKPVYPRESERSQNPRARSARLRAAQRRGAD